MKSHLRLYTRPAAAQGFAPPQTLWEMIAQALGLKQL